MAGAPPEWGFAVTGPKGWVKIDIFKKWLETQLIPHVSPERRLLLLLDNHAYHIDIGTFELAKENGTEIFSLSVVKRIPPYSAARCKILWRSKAQLEQTAAKLGYGSPRCGSGAA